MELTHHRFHLQPNEIASKLAANVMHDIPSGLYITKTIEELQSFIYELQNIRKEVK